MPLVEIVGEALDLGVAAKKVKEEYMKLIKIFGTEFTVLVDALEQTIRAQALP